MLKKSLTGLYEKKESSYLLHFHDLPLALDKYEDFAGAAGPGRPRRVADGLLAPPGRRQEVAGGQGHAQVAVLADGGRVARVDGGVVVGLVPEQEVVGHRHGEDGAAPREGAGRADQGVVVFRQEGAGTRLAVAPFLVLPANAIFGSAGVFVWFEKVRENSTCD